MKTADMAELSTPASARPSRARRVLRWLAYAGGFVLVLLIVAVVALQSGQARRFILNKATALLAQQHISFSTRDFRYNVLGLTTEMRDIKIYSPGLPDAPPFLEVDHATIDLSTWQALRGRYVVDASATRGVRVHYFVNEQGIDNLPRPVKDPDDQSKPIEYLIKNLNVPDAVVRYENRAQGIDLTIPRASLTMKGNQLTGRHAVTIDALNGDVRFRDRNAHLDRIALALDLGRDDVKVERGEVEAEGALLNASGSFGPFANPIVDLAVQATADAARAAEVITLNESVSGQIAVEGTVNGPLAALKFDGQIKGNDLQFRDLNDIALDTAASYETGQDVVRISRLHVTGPIGAIDGEGRVAIRGTESSRLSASVQALRAEPLMRALQLPYRVASRVDGRVNAEWPALDYARATGNANLSLTPTAAVATRSTLPVGGRIEVAGNGDRVDATLRSIRAAGADLNGRVQIRNRDQLSGTLTARAPNVQSTVSTIESFIGRGRGSLLPMSITGALTAEGRISGRVAAPQLAATINAPALSVGDASGIGVSSELTYRQDLLAIGRLDLAWQDATAHASGTIGLNGRQPIDLAVRADALQMSGLLRAFETPHVPVVGIIEARGQVGGTVSNPVATLRVQGTDLVAYNEPFGTLVADGRYGNRQFDVTSLVIDKPQPGGNGRITGTGSYQLGSQRFAIDVQSQNVKLATLTLPGGQRVTGAIDIRALGNGTIPNPAGTINARAADLVVGTYQIGTVVSDTALANGQANTTTTADRLALTAKSTITTSAPYPATIAATVNNLDLSQLPVELKTPLEGRLRATVNASGPLSNPQSGRAEATVDTFSGSWRQKSFQIDGPAHFRYADERLTIDQLTLKAEDSTIAVTGNLPLLDRSAPGAISIDANANLATLVQYAPVGTDVAADGRLTVKGTLNGTLKAVDPNLQIALVDALLLSPQIEPGISNLNASATVANGEANIAELTGNWGAAQIYMSARVPLDLLPELPVEIPRKDGPAQVHARLDNLNPAAIPGAPSGLSGKISFDADVESRRPSLRDAQGKLAFRDLLLGFQGLTLEQKQPSTIAVRNGVAEIEALALSGSVGTLVATGSVGLIDARPINVDVDGNLNIAAVSLVTDRVRAEGDSVIDISARGTVADPLLSGNVSINDGTMVVDEPRIAAEAINARVDLNDNRVNLSTLTADVNGGTVSAKGVLAVRNRGLEDLNVEVALRDFAYDAPLDLRSLSDSDVKITSQGDNIVVSGQVTIQEAGLTGDINFDTGLLASVTARPQLELTPQRNSLLERVAFNLNVDTASPIIVDNNLAKAEVTTDLRVVGTPYELGLLGKMDVAEGGLVTLNERTYEIQRGDIAFVDDRRIYPSFNLSMTTTANNYDITLGVTGEPGNTETSLTSSPALPEPDIMAMLVTGRTLEQMRGAEYDVAREQVLSYLTGRVGSTIGRGVRNATGLDEVRIEPQLIANETNPGARLTLGEDINDNLTLTYSVNLANSDDQVWLATYDVTRHFQTRAVRQSDNTYRVDFRHDIRKGGRPEPRRQPRVRPTIGTITIPDDAPIPAGELRKMLGVEEGKSFDYFAVRNGTEDIEERLREEGWSQSRVRLDRSIDGGTADVRLRIVKGPKIDFSYAGMTPPRKVQDAVRLQWHRGVFDAQRTDDAAETLQEWLKRDNYLQAKVEYRVAEATDARHVQFTITPGPRSDHVELQFQGASGIDSSDLNQVIKDQKLERQLFTDPTVVTELLKRLYREQGFLNVEIDKPRYEFDGTLARVVVPIREGARFTVSDVTVRGNSALATSELLVDSPVVAGDPYMPAAAENALQHIRDLYWAKGYNDVRATYQLTIDRIGGRAGVAFAINEGRQAIVSEIRIAGNDKTTEHLVREELQISPAQPLNLQALSRSRKNLYDSGAFSVVDLSRDTIVESSNTSLVGAISGTTQKPVLVDVAVREVQPYQFRYGASYDTEGKLGGVFDASVHNVFGKARVFGLASRYDAQLREGRLYMTQPTLRYWPIQTTASIYYQEERNPTTSISNAFNVNRKGASLQQERKLKNSYVWNYGYRFEQARRFDPVPGATPDILTKVSPLSSAFVRDVRDEVLDATRGSFTSSAFSFSPKWLGSDDTYIKYYGQYFHYFPLQKERRKRFSNEIIRPRFVFATAARIGISKGMGTFVPQTERFFAGGSTTLRGFEQNAVGPIGADGKPAGGDAMLVFNNELRVPLISLVDGVVFSDIGNVWQRSKDISFTDLRKTAGVGLRLRTKWVLVRTDYGFVLDRREGERKSRFYFSIGQAF